MASATLSRKIPAATVRREIARIQSGFTFRAVENLQKALALPLDKLAVALGMSRATLHRRKLHGKLAAAESERLARYQRLLQQATQVFSNAGAAREWLTAPQRALNGATPFDFATTELGAREVENLLGRLEYGVYS